MFANIKRIISLILLAILLCASGTAMAYSGFDYTTNSSLATKLDNLINGKVAIFSNTSTKFPVGSKLNNSTTYYWASGSYSGKQCYAYGQAAYYYLFGDVPYHGYRDYSYSTTISGVKAMDNLSYDVFIQKGVGCGAYIRTTANSDGSYNGSKAHSMIVLTYDKNNITILHGNADGNGLVTISTYTWAKFNSTHISGKGRYVAHIVQPDLTAFSLSDSGPDGKYQSAPERIAYYHQYMQTDGKTTWNYHTNNTYWDEKLNSIYGLAISDGDGDTPNISGRGCGLLAYGHAIQWLDGKADSTRQIEILAELVKKSKNPPTAEEIYGKYVASEYNAVFGEEVTEWTEEYLRNVFDQDGVVIVCNRYSSGKESGHTALAIGYRVYNGTFYVQMMDSTCRATLKRLPDGGASAKVYDFSAAANLTYSAGQYWVPLKQFSGIIKWSYSLIPNGSSGDNSEMKPTATPKPIISPTPRPTATPTPKPTATPTATPSYTFTPLFDVSAKFTTQTSGHSRVAPYSDAAKVTSLEAGQTITVTRFVKNKYDNIWAQLTDGSYVCFYDLPTKSQKIDFVGTTSKITVAGIPDGSVAGVPKGNLAIGDNCGLRGQITATAPMFSVTARIRDASLSVIKKPAAITLTPLDSVRTVKINSSVKNRDGSSTNINNTMKFGDLTTAGAYRYEVAVQLGFVYMGNDILLGGEQVVIESTFTVGKTEQVFPDVPVATSTPKPTATPTPTPTSTPTPTPTKAPTPTPTQVPTRLPGDVNDDGRVNMKDSIQLLKSLCGWNVTINSANAEVTGDGRVNMKDHILLLKYLCGWNVKLN